MDVCSTFLEKRDEERRNESGDKQSFPMTPLPVQPQNRVPPNPSPTPTPSVQPPPDAPPAANSGTTP
ncbi:hypothetical protein FS749_013318 [Ceratobasidium sp. UAMH 11750]|nr:hypothetical protein FS749_013318 [Ceratobasidium sp. UAMH 11750]